MKFIVNTGAFYGLPPNVEFCKNCVISNQRPNSTIEFGSGKTDKKSTIIFKDGLCSACAFAFEKDTAIDWRDREEQLISLLKPFKRKDGRYDVIVPGSGGKDSAYTAHILKYKYGMNPLTVTWAPHLYTDVGWKNFSNWMHTGGLDNILYTPNGKLHRLLTRLAFMNLLHPFQPFIIGQRIIGPAMAARFGVELVMYGENQAEYGNNVDDNKRPTMDPAFYSNVETLDMKFGGVTMREIIAEHGFSLGDFAPYIPPTRETLESAGVEVLWNDRNGWCNRLLLCCGLIAFIIVAQGWHEQQSDGAPWRVARDVLAAAVIAWLLFKLHIRVTAGRRLADCSYSFYVTHFPVLLLAQSLLISTGSVSVGAAIGGALEAKKAAVQNWLLASSSRLRRLGEGS